jgi:hypothetical protein
MQMVNIRILPCGVCETENIFASETTADPVAPWAIGVIQPLGLGTTSPTASPTALTTISPTISQIPSLAPSPISLEGTAVCQKRRVLGDGGTRVYFCGQSLVSKHYARQSSPLTHVPKLVATMQCYGFDASAPTLPVYPDIDYDQSGGSITLDFPNTL